MTKEEIFNYFYTNSANFSMENMLLILLGGVLIGTIIYLTYKFNYKGVAYNQAFNASLVITEMIAIVIMMMISSNIVISLGMVGALSIVRFRSAIKDSRDTVFLFWAISEGLCVGSSNLKLALVTTIFLAIVITVLSLIGDKNNNYLLIIVGDSKLKEFKINEAVKQYTKKSKLKSINKDGSRVEMIFETRIKNEIDFENVNKLKGIEGVKSINYISESGENIG